MMIVMSGKSTATSSRCIGLEYFSRRPPPPAHAGADAGMAAVEDRRQLVLGDHLVELVGHPVVRKEALHGRMELEALDDAGLDQIARLAHAHLALVRIDGRERHHDVAVLGRGVGDLLVRDAPGADLELAVDREHDEADLALAVVRDGLGDRRPLADLEVFARRLVVRLPDLVVRLAAGHLRMRVHIDGDQIVESSWRAPRHAFFKPCLGPEAGPHAFQ